jgi:RNA polymerase sigma factor (sigma-70 family)
VSIKKSAAGSEFEENVLRVLRLLGYDVRKNITAAGCQIDLYAEYRTGVIPLRLLVECKDYAESSNVGVEDVKDFSGVLFPLRGTMVDKGLLVARHGFTRAAKELAEKAGITLVSFPELTNQLIDFEPYINLVIREFETLPVANHYIDLSFSESEDYLGGDESVIDRPLDDAVNRLLFEEGKTKLALLGNFGTGKSTWCRKYARDLAKQYQADRTRRIPVVIPLTDYEANVDIQQLITNALQFRYGLRIDLAICQELQRLGRLILIFDGFDEMAARVDPEIVRENLREINKISRIPENVFLLTCRTHFFRDKVQAEVLADFDTLFIPEWGEPELREYLEKRFGASWEEQLSKINATHNLAELAQTPLFLEMITETLPSLGDHVRRAELYQAYTSKWIQGQTMRRGARLQQDERREFVIELAMKLFRDDRLSCHYSEFVAIIKNRFQLSDAAQIDYLQNDVRNCTFVTRNPNGNYEFRHKSFMEFFVAEGLSHSIAQSNPEPLTGKLLTPEIRGFLVDLLNSSAAASDLKKWYASGDSEILRSNVLALLIDLRIDVPGIDDDSKTVEDEKVALFSQFLRGDTLAFNKMVSRYYPKLTRLLENAGFDRQLASDSAFDAVMKLLERRERIVTIKDLDSQLIRVARGMVSDRLRKSERARFVTIDEIAELEDSEELRRFYHASIHQPDDLTPEVDVESALKQLSSDEELVIRRLFFDNASVSGVARELGRSLYRVQRLRREALAKLKELLTQSV